MKPTRVQGLRMTQAKALTVGRKLFLSQELNARIRTQHERLRAAYDTIPKSLHVFMVDMLEAYVGKLEEEAEQSALIVTPKSGLTPKELSEIQTKLRAIKEGKPSV